MAFISQTQQKMVMASGAITLLLAWKAELTTSLTSSITASTKFCSLPGTPAVARRAAR
jgi:hypothetical protein